MTSGGRETPPVARLFAPATHTYTTMQLATVLMMCALGATSAVAGKVPSVKGVHHSTKKQLKDPNRFPRKSEVADSTDLDPALAYALPPVGLLHQGRGFGYGLGAGQGLHTLVGLAQPSRPVYHATPLEPYGALLAHATATPIEEPKEEEEPAHHTLAVQAQAHNFVDSPKYYSHNTHEDEYKDYAAKYQFGYRVRDLHTGNDFGQTESRDGHLTQGHYHVLLPDGRLQHVQYWSDDSGFHAKVSYDGHSTHP